MRTTALLRLIGSATFAGLLIVTGAARAEGDAPKPKDPAPTAGAKESTKDKDGKVLEGPRADKEKGGLDRKGFSGPGRGPGGPGGPGRPGPEIGEFIHDTLAKLNLTEDQKTKVKTILDDARKSREEFHSKNEETLKKLHEEAKTARESGDREKGRAAMEKIGKLMENAPKPQDTIDKIKGVLTADQSKQFEEAIEAKKKEMREQMEKRRAEMEKNGEKPGDGKPGEKAKEMRERRRDGNGDKTPPMDGSKPTPPKDEKSGSSDKLNI